MRNGPAIHRLIGRLLGAVAALCLLVFAAGAQDASRVPMPDIPKAAKGDECVAETDFMRRNHMATLKHKRDETVHDGNRVPQFSLTGCIDCHAVAGDDGKPVKIANPRHFCRSCHDYAAVKVDCFQCHASRPGAEDSAALARPPAEAIAALSEYLKEVEQ